MNRNEFKIGDWVTIDNIIFKIDDIVEPNLYSSKMVNDKGLHYEFYDSELELWKPKKGEWCVFYDYDEEISSGALIVDIFKETLSTGYVSNNISGTFNKVAPLSLINTLKKKDKR